jgi:hypothetical protein
MRWRTVSRGLRDLVALGLIPGAGAYGALRLILDPGLVNPLSVLLVAIMMGLVPGAKVADILRRAAELTERDDDSDGSSGTGS